VFAVAISCCNAQESIPTGYNGQVVANLSIAVAPTSATGLLLVSISDRFVSASITPYNYLFTDLTAALANLENLVDGSLDRVNDLIDEIDILVGTVAVGLELNVELASTQAPDAVCRIRQDLINVLNLDVNARISLVNSLQIAYANATAANDTELAAQLSDRLYSASLELEDALNESINATLDFVNCTTTNRTINAYYNYLDSLYINLENLLAARILTLYNNLRLNCTVGESTTELVELANRLLDYIELSRIPAFQSAPQAIRTRVSRRLVSLLSTLRARILNIICCLLRTLATATGAGRQAILDVIQQLIDILNRIDSLSVTASNL